MFNELKEQKSFDKQELINKYEYEKKLMQKEKQKISDKSKEYKEKLEAKVNIIVEKLNQELEELKIENENFRKNYDFKNQGNEILV